MGRSTKFTEESMGVKGSVKNASNTTKHKPKSGKEKATGAGLGKVSSSATDSSGIDLIHLEDVQSGKEKLTKKKKFQRHFKRFWLCYGVGGVIFLAISLPILFLVIVPALAQLLVNKTGLPIYSASLKAVSNNAVIIALTTALDVPAGITVKLDPLDLWLYNKDTPEFTPYTMVPLDGQSVSGHTEIIVTDKTVNVGNRSELHTWLTRTLYGKTTDISVKAHTTAHLGALHFGINLDKTVTIKGLDTLAGFKLDSASVLLPAEEDGSNLTGNLTLPNWSDLTIGLGNLTFNVWAGELLIGSASIFNVLLPPGNSTLPFRGEVFIPTLLDNLLEVVGSQGAAITQGTLELGISGNKTVVDGEHITYLEDVLNGVHILSRIPILQLLGDVLKSIGNGDLDIGGLSDILGDGLGALLDDIFGGGEEDSDDDPMSDLLGDLNMTKTEAKQRLGRTIMTAKRQRDLENTLMF